MYQCEISFMSRGNTRKGSWSTTGIWKRLKAAGYKMQGWFPNRPDSQEIQKVVFSGTKTDCLKQREDIERILRIASGGSMMMKFRFKKLS